MELLPLLAAALVVFLGGSESETTQNVVNSNVVWVKMKFYHVMWAVTHQLCWHERASLSGLGAAWWPSQVPWLKEQKDLELGWPDFKQDWCDVEASRASEWSLACFRHVSMLLLQDRCDFLLHHFHPQSLFTFSIWNGQKWKRSTAFQVYWELLLARGSDLSQRLPS